MRQTNALCVVYWCGFVCSWLRRTTHSCLEYATPRQLWYLCFQYYMCDTQQYFVDVIECRSINVKRLLSNLRPTTCECLHLITSGHFQSRDKDGSHAIWSAIAENSMLHANYMALCFYCWWKFYNRQIFAPLECNLTSWPCLSDETSAGAGGFSTFLLLLPWLWPDDLSIRTWPILPGDIPDMHIWTFYVKAFESYRLTGGQTDTTEIIYRATSWVDDHHYIINYHTSSWQGIVSFCACIVFRVFYSDISMCSCCYCQEFQKKLSGARRVVIVGNGGIATELV